MKLTYDIGKERVSFLDLEVDQVDSKLTVSVQVESTNQHQSFHSFYCHPEHIKWSIIYSRTLRLKRL